MIIKKWTSHKSCKNFTNPATLGSSRRPLVGGVLIAQQTNKVKRLLQKSNTVLVNEPPEFTSRVQPLNVFNKTFKNLVKEQFGKHLDNNLNGYVGGRFTASNWRIPLSCHWIGKIYAKQRDRHSFVQKRWNVDGTKNNEVKIRILDGYIMLLPGDEYHMENEHYTKNEVFH